MAERGTGSEGPESEPGVYCKLFISQISSARGQVFMLSRLAEVDSGLPIFQMSRVRPREVKPPVKLVAEGPGLS